MGRRFPGKRLTKTPADPGAGRRLRREQRTVEVMVRLYCAHHHPGHGSSRPRFLGRKALCPECADLLEYSRARVERCRFGANKPVCAACHVHCFRPERREQIRAVMRYSGPRMLVRHPYLAVCHLLDRRRPAAAA